MNQELRSENPTGRQARLFDSSIVDTPEQAVDFITNILASSTEYSVIGKDLTGNTSGYAGGIIVGDGGHGALEEGLAFLQRPYTRYALIGKIREVLDAGQFKSADAKR